MFARRAAVVVAAVSVAFGMAAPLLQPRVAQSWGPSTGYDICAVLLLAGGLTTAAAWPGAQSPGAATRRGVRLAWLCAGGAVSLILVYAMAATLLPAVFAGPPDVNRGDMLVITEAGVRRALEGRTPYTLYRVPWEMTLSYGPMLWGPFALPVILRADVRVLTLVCYGCTTAALLFASSRAAAARQWLAATAILLLTLVLSGHPAIASFFPIGHTFVYWPLLLLFCALLAADRWTAAAATLGLLIAARTTMVALAPVFLLAARREGRLGWRIAAALALTAVAPFVPFLIADPRSVEFAMYGAYQKTIKGFVWTQTTWAHDTIGVTGALLRNKLQGYVELVQAAALLTVYALSWRSLRRGARPEPWMALALLVFSMTTLWPVSYLYYDVWVLIVAAYAFRVSPPPRRAMPLVAAAAAAFTISIAATLAAGSVLHGTYDLDVGTEAAAPMTGGGFGNDHVDMDGARNFVWVEGTTARVRAPRAAFGSAAIAIDLKPYETEGTARQQLRVLVNGHLVGDPVSVQPGWQTVTVTAAAGRWNYGFNVLTLEFSRTAAEPGTGRQLSAGIDRIRIR
jgi:hypothetical protein